MKKAINISAIEIENITDLPNNWAVISISDEHVSSTDLKINNKKRIFRACFSDITYKLIKDFKEYNPITRNTAQEMISFIEEHKNKNFLINCRAGISRSGAIAVFLNLFYGHTLKENFYFLSEPNPFVLGLLIREYHRKRYENAGK